MSEQSSTDLCLPVLTYRFPTFKVDYYGEGGTVTLFDDNTSSPVAVNKDHVHHAVRLGTTAALFCLSHELCHHLVGIYVMKQPWSPTIWRSAHQTLKASPKFSPEEWYVNAIQYHSMGKDPDDWGAFIDIQDKHKASPTSIMGLLMCLMTVASFPTIREVLIDTGIMPLVAR